MKTRTDVQIINQNGKPAFAVLPYDVYLDLVNSHEDEQIYIPHEVAGLCLVEGLSLIAAWRTYKGLSQAQLADRIGVTQPAIAQIEKEGAKPQVRTLQKIARALGVQAEQLTE